MIGIIIITHGNFGKELFASVENILGKQEFVSVISVQVGDGLDTVKDRLGKVINDPEFPEEKIIIVDIFGGTPSNASLSFVKVPGVGIISGINLPVLIAFFSGRGIKSSSELVSEIIDAGQKGIINIKQKMLEKLGKK